MSRHTRATGAACIVLLLTVHVRADVSPPALIFAANVVVQASESCAGAEGRPSLVPMIDGNRDAPWCCSILKQTEFRVSINLPKKMTIDRMGFHTSADDPLVGSVLLHCGQADYSKEVPLAAERSAYTIPVDQVLSGVLELKFRRSGGSPCITGLDLVSDGKPRLVAPFIASTGGEYPSYGLYLRGEQVLEMSEVPRPFFIEGGLYAVFPFSELTAKPGMLVVNTETLARAHVLTDLWIQGDVTWEEGAFRGLAATPEGEFEFNRKVKLP